MKLKVKRKEVKFNGNIPNNRKTVCVRCVRVKRFTLTFDIAVVAVSHQMPREPYATHTLTSCVRYSMVAINGIYGRRARKLVGPGRFAFHFELNEFLNRFPI